jgi:predicted transcriptional regulator
MVSIKEEARQIIDRLPEECSWEDVMYEIYVRKSIEAGLADSEAGRVHSMDEVRKRFGIKPWK